VINYNDKSTQYLRKNKKSKLKIIFSFLAALNLVFVFGCQTTERRQSVDAPSKPSYWVFKTNVYSSKKNKNISGYTHVTYMNPKLLRLDIYDPLGLINAGILVYKDGNFEALMPLEKKYFTGVASPEVMTQILKTPMDPGLFVNIIFQKGFEDKNWDCTEDDQGFMRECHNRTSALDIVWKKNISNTEGWVVVTHSEGEIDLKLRNSRPIPVLPDEKFILQVPRSYSKFKVDAAGISKL
jgi:hypothetical protein